MYGSDKVKWKKYIATLPKNKSSSCELSLFNFTTFREEVNLKFLLRLQKHFFGWFLAMKIPKQPLMSL